MARPLKDMPLGVYVHVPWCERLCPYCDFAVVVRPEIDHEGYLAAVLKELRARAAEHPGRRLKSIYLGGGTPSLWRADCIGQVIDAARGLWPTDGPLEVTVECNPTAPLTTYPALAARGVNRVSLGIQSFDATTLAALGRRHSPDQARASVRAAQEGGIPRITLDLIFGAPGQDRAAWGRELEAALATGVGHVSLYQLTIEPRTVFGRQVARGRRAAPDDDLCATLYDDADRALAAHGFEHYEVSSWARPGERSRHNGLYWIGAEYLGLGVGAHSLMLTGDGAHRRANPRLLKAYLADPVGSGEVEIVDDRTFLAERMMTGLRTADGVDLEALAASLDLDLGAAIGEPMAQLTAGGYVVRSGRWLRPTPLGLRFGDAVAEAFL